MGAGALSLPTERPRQWFAAAVTVLGLAAVALLLVLGISMAVGYRVLIDRGDSMRPAIAAGDLVVTQDVPLAAQLVPMDVAVLDPRGEEHTAETIGERLSVRDFMDALRMAGAVTGGPRPYDARAKQAFAAALDRALARLTRR